MKINIDNSTGLEAVKEEFSGAFPFLRIEFFKEAHDDGVASPRSDMITEDLTIGDIRSISNKGEIEINGNLKVGVLEQELKSRFGIHAQVFRKSGKLWLETSVTDQWTLNEQNETGKEMS